MKLRIFASAIVTLAVASPSTKLVGAIGVSAVNSAGESAAALDAAGPTMPLPNPATNLQATRTDSKTVRLTWENPASPGQGVVEGVMSQTFIFRAKNDEAWVRVAKLSNAATNWNDTDSDADGFYRYAVAKSSEVRTIFGRGFTCSGPTNEASVCYVPATLSAGASAYVETSGQTLPTGYLTVSGFIPGIIPLPANNETLSGPFDQHVKPDEFTDLLFKKIDGYLPAGVIRKPSILIDSNALELAPFASVTFSADGYLLAPVPVGAPYPDAENATSYRIVSNDAQLAVFSVDFDSSHPKLGFDHRSNPKWQMLPSGGTRDLICKISPSFEQFNPPLEHHQWGMAFSASQDGLYFPPWVSLGETTFPLSSNEATREIRLTTGTHQGGVGVDVRSSKRPTVAIYKVLYTPADPAKRMDKDPESLVKLPDEARLNQVFGEIFGNQANVWPVVTMISEPLRKDNDDGRFVMGNGEEVPFRQVAESNGYDYTIFVMYKMGIYNEVKGEVIPWLGGAAERVGGTFAFVNSVNPELIAHELGHLFGLSHSFERGHDASVEIIPDLASTRLMGYDRTDVRLIKPERDMIHILINFPY